MKNFNVGNDPETVNVRGPEIVAKKTFQEALEAGYSSLTAFAHYFLDTEFYERQEELAEGGMLNATEITKSAGNRTGKTMMAGVWGLHRAFYEYLSPYMRPERLSWKNAYKIFFTSLSQDQANLSFGYAKNFAENPKFAPFVEDIVMSPFPEMKIKTRWSGQWRTSVIGARSLSKNGYYLLGHSLAGVLIDECAFVPNYEYIEEMVLRMRMAEWGGTIFRISSPAGKSNHFYRYYLKGLPHPETGKRDPRYYSCQLSTWDNPYVSKAFLEEQKERMSPDLYRQNVLGEFVDNYDFFSVAVIQKLYLDVEHLLPTPPNRGRTYVMGVDLGALRDATVIIIFDVTEEPYKVVYCQELRQASWESVQEYVAAVWGNYTPAVTYIDNTGVGVPTVQNLKETRGIPGIEPFNFTTTSKPDILTRLQDAAQRRAFVFPFTHQTKSLIDQLSIYKLDDKHIETDYVMALALANKAAEHHFRRNRVDTDIYDDLAIVPVYGQGRGIPNDLLAGDTPSGLRFDIDPDTGLFIPAGGDIDPFGDLF